MKSSVEPYPDVRTFFALAIAAPLFADIQGSVRLFDGDFEPGLWTRINLLDDAVPRGASAQATTLPAGGNPQRCMNLNFDIPANRDGGRFTFPVVFLRTGPAFRYTPSVRGPIIGLTYSEEIWSGSPTLGPGTGQSRGLALRQNGRIYIQTGEVTQKPTTWTRVAASLRAANFAQVGGPRAFLDTASQPDFSATGTEIEFGFWRGHTITPATGGYPYYEPGGGTPAVQSSVAIDNWTVDIEFATARNDQYRLVSGRDFNASLSVIANDRGIPGSRAILEAGPSRGTLTLNNDGTFRYRPEEGDLGDDWFTYRLELPPWRSNIATVTLQVLPPGLSCSVTPKTYICQAGCAFERIVRVYRDLQPEPGIPFTVLETYPSGGTTRLGSYATNSFGEASFRPSTHDSPVQFSVQGTGFACDASTMPIIEVPKREDDGCAFTVLSVDLSDPGGALDAMRQFRDKRLARSEAGRRLSRLYYGATRAALKHLLRNPLLAFSARRAIVKHMPLVSAALAGDMPTLRDADREEIVDLLRRFLEGNPPAELREGVHAAIAALHDPALLASVGVAIEAPANVTAGAPALRYAHLLGGSGDDRATAVASDAQGNIYMTGRKDGVAFVMKLRAGTGEVLFEERLGGSGYDLPLAIVVDTAGNIHIAGFTTSRDFPVTTRALQRTFGGGLRDGFVLKLDATGKSLLQATYLGGREDDLVRALQVDASGTAYVAGWSTSPNFPVSTGALSRSHSGGTDVFFSRIAPDGATLPYSTFLGGKGDDIVGGLALDGAGGIYLAGMTRSPDFPFVNAAAKSADAFVLKLQDGAVAYARLLGGESDDGATGIVVDRAGNAHVAGYTGSARDFPLLRAAEARFGDGERPGIDGFAAKLHADGTLFYSTLLGGNALDMANAVAVDAAGNLFVAGRTDSGDFAKGAAPQSASGGGSDGLLTMLNANGELVFRSPLGGADSDLLLAATVTAAGQFVVAGSSQSADIEASGNNSGAGGDLFVAAFDIGKPGASIARAMPLFRWDSGAGVARDSRISIVASGLANTEAKVSLTDANGAVHQLGVLDAGPGRLEAVVPGDAALGIARVLVLGASGATIASGRTLVSDVVPAITLDGAFLLRGERAEDWDGGEIEAGDGSPLHIVLPGTGARRGRTVRAFAGGKAVDAAVSPNTDAAGLDSVTIGPIELGTAGPMELWLEVDGVRSNRVTVRVK